MLPVTMSSQDPRNSALNPQVESIAGLPLRELASRFGTPTYFYAADRIAEQIKALAAFDVVRFAQKACSNLAIVDWCRRHGALADSVSAGEVKRALAAGYQPQGDPPPIVYTADIFDHAALDLVVEHGVHVNCGSPDMIDQYGERLPGSEITLRINPGFGHGHSQKTNTGGESSKHGIWHTDLPACLERAARHNLTVSGLHVHIGSGTDYEHLAQVAGAMETLAKCVGSSVRSISAGGGLPIPYRTDDVAIDVDAYFELWDATRKKLEASFGHPLQLEIEPGRFLVAEAGYLLCEIRAIKKMGGNLFYLVDAGFNDLARPILYGAYHPMAIAPREVGEAQRPLQPVVVGGPLCESGDIFTQEEGGFVRHEQLPKAEVGDYLVIGCAGAYGAVMASGYNSRPIAAEVLLRDGQAFEIRRRQSFEQIFENESIPK